MDRSLSRRLERTEGAVGSSFTEVRQRLTPEVGAVWAEFGGTYAMFDGAESPMTQTFGLGMFTPVTPEALVEIETFFDTRGAPSAHEVSPLAGVQTMALLADRGYRPVDLGTVLVQALEPSAQVDAPAALRVRAIAPEDRAAWVDTSAMGWSDDPEIAALGRTIATLAAANTTMVHFVVERDGAPIATGSMGIHEGVALLAGASTIPSGRGLGAQGLLLTARLAEAHRQGCELAMMVASPGSASQRNAERRGFRVAYTRTKWHRARGAG